MFVININDHNVNNYAFLFKEYPAVNHQKFQDDLTMVAKTRVRFNTNMRKNAFLPAKTRILDCLMPGEKLENIKHIGFDRLFDKNNNLLGFRSFRVKFITKDI
jgi:hypothetical protein